MDKFLRIAITPPEFTAEILSRCATLLSENIVDLLHLRLPEASEDVMRKAIEAIPTMYYRQVKLHSHYQLISEYGLRGAHLKSNAGRIEVDELRNPGLLSKSCHSVEEVNRDASQGVKYEYVTLSPVYDSLSKSGYMANAELLKNRVPDVMPIIALGGVTREKFRELKNHGFSGAAMIGYYFGDLLSLIK